MASCRRLQEENLQLAKRLQELQTESQEQTAPQPNSSLACKLGVVACFPQLCHALSLSRGVPGLCGD